MADKLKPCPFCGRDMILCDTEFSDFFAYYHKGKHLSDYLCPFALGGTIHVATKKQAIEIWNRRYDNDGT